MSRPPSLRPPQGLSPECVVLQAIESRAHLGACASGMRSDIRPYSLVTDQACHQPSVGHSKH